MERNEREANNVLHLHRMTPLDIDGPRSRPSRINWSLLAALAACMAFWAVVMWGMRS